MICSQSQMHPDTRCVADQGVARAGKGLEVRWSMRVRLCRRGARCPWVPEHNTEVGRVTEEPNQVGGEMSRMVPGLKKDVNCPVTEWEPEYTVMTGPPGHGKRSQVALTWAQLMCWPPSHWVMASSRVSWGVEVDILAEGSKFPQHENYIQFPKWDM